MMQVWAPKKLVQKISDQNHRLKCLTTKYLLSSKFAPSQLNSVNLTLDSFLVDLLRVRLTSRQVHIRRCKHNLLRLWSNRLRQDIHHDGRQWRFSPRLVPFGSLWHNQLAEQLSGLLPLGQFLRDLLWQVVRFVEQARFIALSGGRQTESEHRGPDPDHCGFCRRNYADHGLRSARENKWDDGGECRLI